MKVYITILFIFFFLHSYEQKIPIIKKVVYDSDSNITASLDYINIKDKVEATFKDTSTNIRYRIDKSHTLVSALLSNGDTLWSIDPYIILRNEDYLEATTMKFDTITKSYVDDPNAKPQKVDNLDRPDYITAVKFEKNNYDHERSKSKKGETILCIKANSRHYGFIELNTGKFYTTRIGW